MDITWLGHAALRIRSGGRSLVMDPFPSDLGLRIPPAQAQANVATQSSDDPLHSAIDALSGEPVALAGPGEYEASGMYLQGIRIISRAAEDAPQRWNTIFTVLAEGLTCCHLGNPDRLLTNREIDQISSAHILMIPVGSHTGLSAADAAEIVKNVEPGIVIPMMYAHAGNQQPLREIAPFLHEMGVRQPEPQNRLTVTRTTLPEETQVVVLQPAATLI